MSFIGYVQQQSSKLIRMVLYPSMQDPPRWVGEVVLGYGRQVCCSTTSGCVDLAHSQTGGCEALFAWQISHKHAYCRSLQAFDNDERKVPKQKEKP